MAEATSDLPLVTAIVPAFNHERYIAQSIRSVLDQTYPNVELIVIDDCSADGTAQVAGELASEHGFQFERNEANRGLNASLEKALALARGEFVCMVSADDWLAPDKLEWQVAYLKRTGRDAVYATGWQALPDGQKALIDLAAFENWFADGSALQRLYVDDTQGPLLQTALVRRGVLLDLWPERARFKSDDWVTLIRLVERYDVGFVNRPCFYYRQHEGNTYRKYWHTLPMRLEVVCNVTPETLRTTAIANILSSMATYLEGDGKLGQGLKFRAAALALNPAPATIGKGLARAVKAVVRRVAGRSNNRSDGR